MKNSYYVAHLPDGQEHHFVTKNEALTFGCAAVRGGAEYCSFNKAVFNDSPQYRCFRHVGEPGLPLGVDVNGYCYEDGTEFGDPYTD